MKRKNDERIIKSLDKLTAPIYPVIIGLTLIVVIIKIYLKSPIEMFLLEGLALFMSLGYYLIANYMKGILFAKPIDDCIKEIKDHIGMISFMICFWIYIIGEFILMLIFNDQIISISFYFLIWLLPAVILTFQYIRKGLFIMGTKKAKSVGMKKFKKKVIIGSLFYGIFTEYPHLLNNGNISLTGILWILGSSLVWGIPFYFIMKLLVSTSEKYADEQLEQSEN